ncbi:nuclease s1 [Podospora conica]|nr:nuclease s1 [Schizothecium conicum]
MKLSSAALTAAALPLAHAWGGFGHITVAYLASSLVAPPTTTYLQTLLRNSSTSYLAGVATWADSLRYSKYYRFTSTFHFIDAKDSPPHSCSVDLARDCKASGCVVSALANYTTRLLDTTLSPYERAVAAKFVVHFVGDIHQPLHAEDVARGGNGIHVRFDGVELNLHHVWDSSIAEKLVGGGVRRQPYAQAREWADRLVEDIRGGRWREGREGWLEGVDVGDAEGTALGWARESNQLVCSHVLPEGPEAIVGQELGRTEYYDKAAPVVELAIAKAGYRLAAWLDMIVARIQSQQDGSGMGDL